MKRWFACRVVAAASLAWLSLLAAPPVAALYVTGSELVTGTLATPEYTDAGTTFGPFGLDFSYVRSFDGTRVAKDVRVDFLFDTRLGYDTDQQAAYRARVEANIEAMWNDEFILVDTASLSIFPVVVDLATVGPRFDQIVTVHPGVGRADALNWFVEDTPSVNAHEFGHLLGLFDEYIGGAVDRHPDPTLSDTGLMGLGALSATPEMLPRYYEQYLDYISALNPDHSFELTQVPGPSTIILVSLGSGTALLLARGRRRRR